MLPNKTEITPFHGLESHNNVRTHPKLSSVESWGMKSPEYHLTPVETLQRRFLNQFHTEEIPASQSEIIPLSSNVPGNGMVLTIITYTACRCCKRKMACFISKADVITEI